MPHLSKWSQIIQGVSQGKFKSGYFSIVSSSSIDKLFSSITQYAGEIICITL